MNATGADAHRIRFLLLAPKGEGKGLAAETFCAAKRRGRVVAREYAPQLVATAETLSANARLAEPLNYTRFFVDQLLPADAETAIYLDSDVTVRASLADLDAVARRKFAANTSALVAVVPREYKNVCKGFVNCRHAAIRRVFPRPEAELHAFNVGVVVFHVRRWAAQHVRDKAKAWILENPKTTERQTRVYTLGSNPPFMLAVGRRWAALDRRWNCMRGLRRQRLHNTRCWADAYVRHFPGSWRRGTGGRWATTSSCRRRARR